MGLLKDSFKNVNGWGQLFCLFLLTFIGMIAGSIASAFIILIAGGGNSAGNILSLPYAALQAMQILSVLFTFFIPAIGFAFLFGNGPKRYMKLKTPYSWLYTVLTIAFVVSIIPLINLTGFINEQLKLPESMVEIERVMKSMADSNAAIMTKLLTNDSVIGVFTNLFVIAFLAALVEEFFFRGCLQQIMVKITNSLHAGIWLTALIFSAIHFDIYGFVPRVLLGAMLGYIFVWSGNLMYAVLAHFINNAAIVLMQQLYYRSPILDGNSFDAHSDIPYLLLGCIALAITIYFFNKYKASENIITP